MAAYCSVLFGMSIVHSAEWDCTVHDILIWETYFLGVFIYCVAMLNWGNTANAVAGSFWQKLLSNNFHAAEMATMGRKLKYVEFEAEIL